MLDGISYEVKPELGPGQATPWQIGKMTPQLSLPCKQEYSPN